MSMNYSLRSSGIGRLTPPSPYTLTATVNRERDATAAMNQPGASQMIGYRFAAEQDRVAAQNDYDLGLAEHNASLIAQRDEDYQRGLEDRGVRLAHAMRMSAMNNPSGAAMSSDPEVYSLIAEDARGLFRDNLRADIANKRARGAGRGTGNSLLDDVLREQRMLASQEAAAVARVEGDITRRITALRQQRATTIREADRVAIDNQTQQLDAGRAAAIAEARRPFAEQRARLPQITPQGTIQWPGGTAPAGPPSPAPAANPQAEQALRDARAAIATGRISREQAAERLRNAGIDPVGL